MYNVVDINRCVISKKSIVGFESSVVAVNKFCVYLCLDIRCVFNVASLYLARSPFMPSYSIWLYYTCMLGISFLVYYCSAPLIHQRAL